MRRPEPQKNPKKMKTYTIRYTDGSRSVTTSSRADAMRILRGRGRVYLSTPYTTEAPGSTDDEPRYGEGRSVYPSHAARRDDAGGYQAPAVLIEVQS